MGRKKIGRRLKTIIIQVDDELAYFSYDKDEKLTMKPETKKKIINHMRNKFKETFYSNQQNNRLFHEKIVIKHINSFYVENEENQSFNSTIKETEEINPFISIVDNNDYKNQNDDSENNSFSFYTELTE